MAELPHPWGVYAQQQRRLARRPTVDDLAWGFESSLNVLCAGMPTFSHSDDLRRATATGARRERHRASLCRRRALEAAGSADWIAQAGPDGRHLAEARSELRHLARTIPAAELNLLVSIGCGMDRGEVASALSIKPEALRTRLSRARRLAAKALAL